MILTKKDLDRLQESMRHLFTSRQKQLILDAFGTEPDDYVWTERKRQIDRHMYSTGQV